MDVFAETFNESTKFYENTKPRIRFRIFVFFRVFVILLPPIVVFLLHLLRMIFLPLHFELDRVAHLFGGLTIAWATANFYREAQARSWIPRFSMIVWSFVVVATAELIGTLWEFLEFYLLNDLVPHFGMMLPDTIDDLTLDLLGAILFVAVLAPRMEKFLRRRTS